MSDESQEVGLRGQQCGGKGKIDHPALLLLIVKIIKIKMETLQGTEA